MDVLLDAAAFVPTSGLDLSVVKPEFVAISFYNMFGYPTGIGALLIRKAVSQKLKRPWFSGGTVNFASVQGNGYYLAPNEAAFEDGKVNYLNIPAIKTGLQDLEKVGIKTIGKRVHCLTSWLLDNLLSLQHSNGKPMIAMAVRDSGIMWLSIPNSYWVANSIIDFCLSDRWATGQ